MDEKFIRDRISALRIEKGVSEYKMSLDLGHSKGYIQSISSGRALPSMNEFLYMCEYFEITPVEFFENDSKNTALVHQLCEKVKCLSTEELNALLLIVSKLVK